MSRYIKELENGKTVAYGFELPKGYYIKVYDVEEDNVQHMIFGRASNQGMSNSEMLYLMDIHGLPESHIEQVAMDLPIK